MEEIGRECKNMEESGREWKRMEECGREWKRDWTWVEKSGKSRRQLKRKEDSQIEWYIGVRGCVDVWNGRKREKQPQSIDFPKFATKCNSSLCASLVFGEAVPMNSF